MSSPEPQQDGYLQRPELGGRNLSATQVAALREQFGSSPPIPNIPLRGGGAGDTSESSTPAARLSPRPSSSNLRIPNTDADTSNISIDDLTDEQKAEIVGRHLVDKQGQRRASRRESAAAGDASTSAKGKLKATVEAGEEVEEDAMSDEDADDIEKIKHMQMSTDEFPMPFGLQGGDVTHDLYKWQRTALANSPANPKNLKRSKSTGALSSEITTTAGEEADTAGEATEGADAFDSSDPMQDYKKIMVPGGFRRNFIARQAGGGDSGTSTPGSVHGRVASAAARPGMPRATSSFVEFLSLYGHYAGETLEEIDEEDDKEMDEEEALRQAEQGIPDTVASRRGTNERAPLLTRKDTRARIARKRVSMKGEHGEATVLQAVMMLLKSFVGTGILFLGKAFSNGGMLFSIIVLFAIAGISLYSFLLLVKTRLVVPGSFGDMGGVLYGNWMRIIILTSITLSQVGFVSAYTIFVAENLVAFILAVTNCRVYIPVAVMIFAQMIFYLPLAMFRNIQKLSGTALVADAFILIGIVYIFSKEIAQIKDVGWGPDIVAFNSKNYALLIGTAVFAFEGVGLVIPITEAMREPHKFPKVLSWVMLGVALLFGGAGALGYAAFGKDIQTVVLVNLSEGKDDRFVSVVQFLYSIAIMLSTPLQLFPAVRIMEQGIFSEASGKYSNRVKWQKNVFRSAVVLGCAMISWLGAADLDKFVSLIGSVACIPLALILPAALALKTICDTRWMKVKCISLIVFGFGMMIFSGSQTLQMLLSGEKGAPPNMGKCKPPL